MPIGVGHAVGGGAIIGAIVALWGNIKGILLRIYSIFIVRYDLDSDIYSAVSIYCWQNFKRLPLTIHDLVCQNIYIKPQKSNGLVAAEKVGGLPTIFFKGLRPLFFSDYLGQGTGKKDIPSKISFIRGTFDGDRLISEALQLYNKKYREIGGSGKRFFVRYMFGTLGKSFLKELKEETTQKGNSDSNTSFSWFEMQIKMGVFKPIAWTADEIGYSNTRAVKLIDNLALTDEQINLVNEALRWRNSQDWYEEKYISWRRGWLFYGNPGTGKSKLALALAEKLDLPIYVFDLSTMTNEDFLTKWHEMQMSNPCLALIEDIDTVFKGRTNLNRTAFQNCLTFDCFLNVIDGVGNTEGIFTIITTNRLDDIDSAIGLTKNCEPTRPGRIDRIIQFRELDEAGRIKIAKRILSNGDLGRVVREGQGETGAQFQERCTRIALAKYWDNKDLASTPQTPKKP